MVSYSDNGTAWQDVKDNNGVAQVFTGNSVASGISESTMGSPIIASYIRVVPTLWVGHSAFRLEILGCPLPQSGRQTCWKANYVTGMPSSDMFSTTKTNFGECGKECHGQDACYAFTLNQGSGQCQGHSYTNYVNANIQNVTTSASGESSASLLKQEDCL
ncbi:uncharacterized protein LOC110454210 [Mizuhopecten yessoensis]|nr:uncharacterized protein LOC110454210 [Mizuhopecten yessoensis]